MVQLFIFGASSAYGVGGQHGGWADLLKQSLHSEMYSPGGVGEKYEVYNFGKPGATIEFVQNTFKAQLEQYGRSGKIIAIVSVGGNNSKAEERPDNFVSTPEEYRQQLTKLLGDLQKSVDDVIVLGGSWVDEAKTNPKHNPLTGGKSYFTNARRRQFETVRQDICRELGIKFVDIAVSEQEWRQKYLYDDGLHPNDEGYQLICEAVKNHLGL